MSVDEKTTVDESPKYEAGIAEEGEIINVSGHAQELDRSFGVLSVCAVGIISNNAWGAGGGTLVIALYNGGGPGVLYGLLAAAFFYAFICLGLAELASAIPSSANVYHWASVTGGPKYGRVLSWYGGWFNGIAWVFGAAAVTLPGANVAIAVYALYHPEYVPERWHVFIAYLGITAIDGSLVLFGQKYLARAASACGMLCMLIVFISTMVCAIMPSRTGAGYASNSFVWSDFQNLTGWSSNGFVFLMGMLNGAFTVGTPDGVCHMCEEMPNPRVNVPKGIAAQIIIGLLSTFCFFTAILYSITSLDDVFATNIVSLPLAAIYQQATRSNAGTTALLILFLVNFLITIPGCQVVCGRMLWTLARDDATPASHWLRRVSPRWKNPFNAQLVVIAGILVLGCVYIGSATAFNAIVGSFAIMTTLSYLSALLPHLLTGRRNIKPGPFWMPSPWGEIALGIASTYIIVFNVIYCFPFSMPVTALGMNYASVMVGGITVLLTGWYLWKRKHGYAGPRVALDARDDIVVGIVGGGKSEEEGRGRSLLS
ncbi:hypothetical protein LTR95_005010 [Oleoguttula sp. CCFEE 5521]